MKIMKTFKSLFAILGLSIITLTSCQDEVDVNNGENPNTNSSTSATAKNLERSAMHDGSFDDFLDGTSCSSIILPVTATINNTQITVRSESDYQLVLNILGQFTSDAVNIKLQFPLKVRLSDYTQVTVANQTEYNALISACETAENQAKSAINCLDIQMPITILTYDLKAQQTGSVVIESKQELYTYINSFDNTALFAIKYPIKAAVKGEGSAVVEITSDMDLQSRISECLETEAVKEDASQNAKSLESILVNGLYKVDSYVQSGTDTANAYANYTINFANDLSVTAKNSVNPTLATVNGSFKVVSEIDVFLNITFSSNTAFMALNKSWKVTSYSQTSISLQSKTDAAVKLVLSQI